MDGDTSGTTAKMGMLAAGLSLGAAAILVAVVVIAGREDRTDRPLPVVPAIDERKSLPSTVRQSETRQADGRRADGPAGDPGLVIAEPIRRQPEPSRSASSGRLAAAEITTHKELLALLRSRGLSYGAVPVAGQFPTMLFMKNNAQSEAGKEAGIANELLDSILDGSPASRVPEKVSSRATVALLPSAQLAKEVAGSLGSRSFSWGRFVFEGDQLTIAEFRKALE